MADPNDPPRDVRRWKKGQSITESRLNETVDAINRISGGIKRPRQIGSRPIPTGTTSKIQQFKIVSVSNDYLVCYPYNSLSINSSTIVLIAKPYLLRRTPFDGGTRNGVSYTYTNAVTRTATSSPDSETQVITPSYVANDIIYAVRNIIGKTDVLNSNNAFVEWLDINADGRAWAVQAS